jgi:hypothetical protein
MELAFLKMPHGALVPMDEPARERTEKWRSGAVIRGDFKEMRNGAFFRKWWSLVQFAFDIWEGTREEKLYKGEPVQANFDRFRKDVTIMAGHYDPVYAASGEVRLEAKSLRWDKMNEQEFEELYSKTIDVILQKVLKNPLITEDTLRNYVDRVIQYA